MDHVQQQKSKQEQWKEEYRLRPFAVPGVTLACSAKRRPARITITFYSCLTVPNVSMTRAKKNGQRPVIESHLARMSLNLPSVTKMSEMSEM
jgi:hypothetical protein